MLRVMVMFILNATAMVIVRVNAMFMVLEVSRGVENLRFRPWQCYSR